MQRILNVTINLVFFFFSNNFLFAQPGWYPVTSGTDQGLNSIFFPPSGASLGGYAAGDQGTILRTTDAGESWISQISGTTNELRSIFFVDLDLGFAAGWNRTILKTTNGGNTWTSLNSGTTDPLFSIQFADAMTGWAVGLGATILLTTDGGTNWFEPTTGATVGLFAVSFGDANTSYAVGNNTNIWKTTDGGLNWTRIQNGIVGGAPLLGVHFLSPDFGVVVGDFGIVQITTDGGNTWNVQNIDDHLFHSVYFLDFTIGFIAGTPGIIFRTTDGGLTWEQQNANTSEALFSIQFTDINIGYVCGSNGTIQKTTNGGIPVELISFSAFTSEGKVYLNWITATETNNSGFEIERKLDNSEWFQIGFVEGNGTTSEISHYQFVDSDISTGSYVYRLKQVDFDGTFEYSDGVLVEMSAPLKFALEQNYPNPFNPITTINYKIPNVETHGLVSLQLKIFDVLGREIETLVNEIQPSGNYEVEFDGSNLSSGVYYYRIQVYPAKGKAGVVETKKMLLLK